jgi:hypothetical protein
MPDDIVQQPFGTTVQEVHSISQVRYLNAEDREAFEIDLTYITGHRTKVFVTVPRLTLFEFLVNDVTIEIREDDQDGEDRS